MIKRNVHQTIADLSVYDDVARERATVLFKRQVGWREYVKGNYCAGRVKYYNHEETVDVQFLAFDGTREISNLSLSYDCLCMTDEEFKNEFLD